MRPSALPSRNAFFTTSLVEVTSSSTVSFMARSSSLPTLGLGHVRPTGVPSANSQPGRISSTGFTEIALRHARVRKRELVVGSETYIW